MQKNKRMIYIWDENLDYYDELAANKQASSIINEALAKARRVTPQKNENIDYVKQKLAEIDNKNK